MFALLPKLFEEIRIAKDASWANMTGAKCFHTDHDQGGSWLYLGNIGKVRICMVPSSATEKYFTSISTEIC